MTNINYIIQDLNKFVHSQTTEIIHQHKLVYMSYKFYKLKTPLFFLHTCFKIRNNHNVDQSTIDKSKAAVKAALESVINQKLFFKYKS